MNHSLIDRIARAVLYEGYVLYPYRRSSLKNSRRLSFGMLYPQPWTAAQSGSDRSHFQMTCLLLGTEATRISVLVRFLQLVGDEQRGESVEREVCLEASIGEIEKNERRHTFLFGGSDDVRGEAVLQASRLPTGAYKLALTVRNITQLETLTPARAMLCSLASAHTAVTATGGAFVSMADPPENLADDASQCVNIGVWPVLVGQPGTTDTILASPIILSDYPEVAAESNGDLFDATEIDEILTLRILTLTEGEKAEVRGSEERVRNILERAETLPSEHLLRLHGTIRGLAPASSEPWSAWDSVANAQPPESIRVNGSEIKAGDRVRLRPNKRADILDSALNGRVAVIASVEQDFENNVHLAVVVEEDPGRDLGEMKQIGHRFFFSPSEVELIEA